MTMGFVKITGYSPFQERFCRASSESTPSAQVGTCASVQSKTASAVRVIDDYGFSGALQQCLLGLEEGIIRYFNGL